MICRTEGQKTYQIRIPPSPKPVCFWQSLPTHRGRTIGPCLVDTHVNRPTPSNGANAHFIVPPLTSPSSVPKETDYNAKIYRNPVFPHNMFLLPRIPLSVASPVLPPHKPDMSASRPFSHRLHEYPIPKILQTSAHRQPFFF